MIIPILLVQSFCLWISIFSRTSYTYFIDVANCFKEITFWILTFFAMAVDISKNQTDIGFCVLVGLSVLSCSALAVIYKKVSYGSKLEKISAKNDVEAEESI